MEKYIVMAYVVKYAKERDGYEGNSSIEGLFHSREEAERFIENEFFEPKQKDENGDYSLVLETTLETVDTKKRTGWIGDTLYIYLYERGFLDDKIES